MRYLRHLVATLVLLSFLAACAANPSPPATDPTPAATLSAAAASIAPTNPPIEISPIPVIRTEASQPPGIQSFCAGVGLAAILRGDPADPKVAWLEQFPSGPPRIDIIWPAGYSARFNPGLEILDQTGHVAIREGDFVDGGCVTREPDVLSLNTGLLALRLVCGPMPVLECSHAQLFQIASANGWPEREIAELRFLDADGRYVIVFEDGSQATGVYVPN